MDVLNHQLDEPEVRSYDVDNVARPDPTWRRFSNATCTERASSAFRFTASRLPPVARACDAISVTMALALPRAP